jgi:hypothetical protein
MTETLTPPVPHKWKFARIGGIDMVRLESAEDLLHLSELDQKLWSALACPVKGLEIDEKTLDLLDADKDGRIRAPEVKAAVSWSSVMLENPAILFEERDNVQASEVKDTILASSIRWILKELKADPESSLSLAQVADMTKILAATRYNGDGVITAQTASKDPVAAELISLISKSIGTVTDRSGKPGVDLKGVQDFFQEANDYIAWKAEFDESSGSILTLGEGTAAAADALAAVEAKVEDFFARVRLADYDDRALAVLNGPAELFKIISEASLKPDVAELSGFPLASIKPGRNLPLGDGINPSWRALMDKFFQLCVTPILSKDQVELSLEDFKKIQSRLAPYRKWIKGRKGHRVEVIGVEKLNALLTGDSRAKVEALINKDLEFAPQFAAMNQVERLLRYCRDLVRLLHNFVNLLDFYDPRRFSVFQSGVLYLDSRACNLVIKVGDPARHAAMAGLSKAYLAYCDCKRPSSGEAMQIVAAFTNGDSDFLTVGRNGVFYDRKGNDWDVTIARVVENPISIRQSFFAPYKKLVRMIEEQAAKRAASAEAASDAKLAQAANQTVNVDQVDKAAPKKIDVGTVAAIGVAASAMVAVLTAIIGGILGLTWWQIPLAVLGVMLLISGPSMIIAALKLRQRNLGPILDANGWAINGRLKINIPFGASLTHLSSLPAGSQLTLNDPFKPKSFPWKRTVLAVLLLGFAGWVGWDYAQEGRFFWQFDPVEETLAEPAGGAGEPSSVEPAGE